MAPLRPGLPLHEVLHMYIQNVIIHVLTGGCHEMSCLIAAWPMAVLYKYTLHISSSETRMFLAARSLWTKALLDR